MKLHISFIALLVTTNLFLFATPASQTSSAADIYEDVFLYAQKLEQGGAYDQAELEYKRYIFLQDYSEGLYQTQAFTSLAGLYEKNEQWELAAQTIQKAILSQQNNDTAPQEQQDKLKLDHIRFLEKTTEGTSSRLYDNLFIFSYINLPEFSDEIKQYANLCSIENDINKGRFLQAQQTFENMATLFPNFFSQEDSELLKSNFTALDTLKLKKPLLAGYLSIFPGLGQLYAGNFGDSLNAFLLNGALIAVSAYSIWTLDFWTFSLLEFNLVTHFMKGNIYNAQKDAYQYNENKQNIYKNQIKSIIERNKHKIY